MALTIRRRFTLTLALAIIFSGAAVWWYYQYLEQDVRKNLSIAGLSAAACLNGKDFTMLTNTKGDLESTAYQELRGHLTRFGNSMSSTGIRWLYTVAVQGQKAVFQVDSIPEGAFGHEDPGTEYKEPPEELFSAWRTGSTIISRPYEDEYGKFVSIFVPLKNEATGQVVSVLGIDLDYDVVWKKTMLNLLFVAVYCLLIISLFVLFSLYSGARMRASEALHQEKERYRKIAEASERMRTELEVKTERLEKMNSLMVGREIKMIELKQAIQDLKQKP